VNILLLSAYDADSHQYWRKGLVSHFSEHNWSVLTLPARYFSWRIRGNSLSWAFGEHREVLLKQYDLVIATSMTDLSALRGFIPSLAATKTIVYFHENQFAYPATDRAQKNVEPMILNLYTALSADQLIFNSQFNFQTFITGAAQLLKKLPDFIPSEIIGTLTAKSTVIPVPLITAQSRTTTASQQCISTTGTAWLKYMHYTAIDKAKRPILIAWAARWEYDKGPDRLLAIITALEDNHVDFRLCIMGQKFRHIPESFQQIEQKFAHRLDQFGYADTKAEYMQWLKSADIFLSTAVHEFQGLSVLEAVHAHCIPVLPKRLVYPELFADQYLYEGSEDIATEAKSAATMIASIANILVNKHNLDELIPIKADFSWSALKPKYQKIIDRLN
jgi:glycosyltransferase involved in cell wall biosynthesis